MNGIYGRAATGLQDSSWAVNENVAKVGAKGEQKTEALLNGFGKKAAVLHDLRIPLPGFKANIDHAIVSGKSVLLIDSKMWKPGFYWSLLGYRRGWEKTPHIGKSQEYVSRAHVLNPEHKYKLHIEESDYHDEDDLLENGREENREHALTGLALVEASGPS